MPAKEDMTIEEVPTDNMTTHADVVAHFMDHYPAEHIDEEVQLFARKSGNPAVAELVAGLSRPYTREHLRQILELCTGAQISHVGW